MSEVKEIKIVRGNTFATRTHVRAYRFDGTEIDNFDLSACTDIEVSARSTYKKTRLAYVVQDGNNLRVVFHASMQHVGKYGLEVTGKHNGVDWRFYNRHLLTIVDSNAEAEIPEESIIEDDYYEVDGAVLVLSDTYDDTEIRAAIQLLQTTAQGLGERLADVEAAATSLAQSANTLSAAVEALSTRITPLEGGDFH
jgi:hypothetical protein